MVRVIAEVTFSPLGTATPSLSKHVAAGIAVLKRHPEVTHQLTPMSTILEGERADILALVEELNEAIFASGVQRVGTALKIDERRDKPASMQHKIDAVMEEISRDK